MASPAWPAWSRYTPGSWVLASFGASGHVVASKGDGDGAVNGSKGFLGVPLDYVSESALSNSMEFAGQTFASIGLTPGTYTWTWGSGANADSLTVLIGAAAVPEPTTVLTIGPGLLGLAVLRYRQGSRDRRQTLAS